MRNIEIEWRPLGITVTAELSESTNRRLSDLFWSKLPYCSLQNHALVSGEHLYHLVPFAEFIYTPAEYKEDRTQSPDGTLFLSQLQHLAIKYGKLSEYIPAAPVGYVIADDIPRLREAGRACWHATYQSKQIVEVHVRRSGQNQRNDMLLPRMTCDGSPRLRALLERIQDENEKVWLTPPREILDLHAGDIASGAGSYDQYLSTLVFLNGETRPLGYCVLNGLLRLSHTESLSLDVLREMTPNFIRTPAEFLGYCGLDTLWSFTQQLIAVLPDIQTKAQYQAIIGALALYANILNTWNLQYFPWRHGQEYSAVERAPKRVAPSLATA